MLMESFPRSNLREFEFYLSGFPKGDLRQALRRVENDCKALLLEIFRGLQQVYLNSSRCQICTQRRTALTQFID